MRAFIYVTHEGGLRIIFKFKLARYTHKCQQNVIYGPSYVLQQQQESAPLSEGLDTKC